MAGSPLLTVSEVASEFHVTAQTIRNWIEHGVLPAVRVGRGYRIGREEVDALLERASAESASLATRRDVWAPTSTSLPRRRDAVAPQSVWEVVDTALPAKKR
jgi:excisionase family DNA binding protein